MTSMRRHYVASTSLRRHVPAGNLPPPLAPQYSKPWPPQYSKPSYAYEVGPSLRWTSTLRYRELALILFLVLFKSVNNIHQCAVHINTTLYKTINHTGYPRQPMQHKTTNATEINKQCLIRDKFTAGWFQTPFVVVSRVDCLGVASV